MIDQRLCNKESYINASIDKLSKRDETNTELCIRPLYPSYNGCHVTMGKAPRDSHDYSRGGVSLASNDIHPL